MATTTQRTQVINREMNAMEEEARQNAMRQKMLAAKRAERDVIADKVTGEVFKVRHFTLSSSTDFTQTANVANILSQIGILNNPGVPVGLEFAFAPIKESYGNEYVALRTYGLIRDAGPANINVGRLVVRVESPQRIEKERLLDISPQRFNGTNVNPNDRNNLLVYSVSETFRATQGDFIVWLLNSPTVASPVATNTFWAMEVLALEKRL